MSIRAALTADACTYARFGWCERNRAYFAQVVELTLTGDDQVLVWETGLRSTCAVAHVLAPFCTLSAETMAALEHDRRGDPLQHQRGV